MDVKEKAAFHAREGCEDCFYGGGCDLLAGHQELVWNSQLASPFQVDPALKQTLERSDGIQLITTEKMKGLFICPTPFEWSLSNRGQVTAQ